METEKIITLKTTMTCNSCVAKVQPKLLAQGVSKNLQFNMDSPDKTVQFVGGAPEKEKALQVLKDLGYKASLIEPSAPAAVAKAKPQEQEKSFLQAFKPLLIIAVFLLGTTALVEINAGSFSLMRAMNVFMGAFFIVFSFFKFLDIAKFAEAFSTYDTLGARSRTYALAYPFIELFLGVSFVLHFQSTVINLLTIVLMVIGNIGVWNVLKQKRTIQCACLGTVFNLPMTKVTLFENTLMLVMSVAMLSLNS